MAQWATSVGHSYSRETCVSSLSGWQASYFYNLFKKSFCNNTCFYSKDLYDLNCGCASSLVLLNLFFVLCQDCYEWLAAYMLMSVPSTQFCSECYTGGKSWLEPFSCILLLMPNMRLYMLFLILFFRLCIRKINFVSEWLQRICLMKKWLSDDFFLKITCWIITCLNFS